MEAINKIREGDKGRHVILNERPDDMTFEEYRKLRAIQNGAVRRFKKGQFIYIAKNLKLKDKGKSFIKPKQK